jgi:hypothetical protein
MKLGKNGILIGAALLLLVGIGLWLGLSPKNPLGTGGKQIASPSTQLPTLKEFTLAAREEADRYLETRVTGSPCDK